MNDHAFTSIIHASRVGAKYAVAMALSAALLGVVTSRAQTVEEVGQSVRIKNQVSASLNNRSLSASDPVFSSENITAFEDSHGEILLNDRSKVLVGENSTISLDEFVVGSRGFSNGTIKVAKGAFRFITGNSEKGAFNVETPVSTIGARGTAFDVYVGPDGNTRVILFQGEVEVCSSSNCIVTNRACDIVDVDNSTAREADYLRFGNRQEENELFDLTNRQGRFQFGWRAPTLICSIRAAFDPARRISTEEDTPNSDNTPDFGDLSGTGPDDGGKDSCGASYC